MYIERELKKWSSIGKEKSTMTYQHDISHHDVSAWHIIYMSWRCHHDIYRVLICHGAYFEDISQYVVMTYHMTYKCHHDISNDVSHDVSPWHPPRMTYRMTPVTIRHCQDISHWISWQGRKRVIYMSCDTSWWHMSCDMSWWQRWYVMLTLDICHGELCRIYRHWK